MIELNMGFTWDVESIRVFRDLNAQAEITGDSHRITEVYGALPRTTLPLPQARPDFRLPDIDILEAELVCKILKESGIRLNYTVNGTDIPEGFDVDTNSEHAFFEAFDTMLECFKPDIVTIAHPYLLQLIASEYPQLDIEISTILGCRTLTGVAFYASMPSVKKICLDIYRNRDISFLSNAVALAKNHGTEIELIANEFCMVGGATCGDLYRNSCYLRSSQNETLGSAGYPKKECTISRNIDASSWLKAPFILPEWLHLYLRNCGIHHYKITGRTHPPVFTQRLAKQYMSGESPENLLELWLHLDNIGLGEAKEYRRPPHFIPTAKISGYEAFIRRWMASPEFRCSDACGYTCKYCDTVCDKIVKLDYVPGEKSLLEDAGNA